MSDTLKGLFGAKSEPYKKKLFQEEPASSPSILDVSLVSRVSMCSLLRDSQNELFSLSLYELDRLIQQREGDRKRNIQFDKDPAIQLSELSPDLDTPRDDIRRVPGRYHGFTDVFSKEASNELPPNRVIDYKITLDKPLDLGYSPLY